MTNLEPVLVWVSPKAEPEAGITMQVVYLGGDCRKLCREVGMQEREDNKDYIFKLVSTEGN